MATFYKGSLEYICIFMFDAFGLSSNCLFCRQYLSLSFFLIRARTSESSTALKMSFVEKSTRVLEVDSSENIIIAQMKRTCTFTVIYV